MKYNEQALSEQTEIASELNYPWQNQLQKYLERNVHSINFSC